MAVGAVRALLAAHLQATLNRSRKELGQVGATLLAILIAGFAVLALVPLGLGSAVLGWVVGGALDQPKGVYVLGGVLTLLTAGGGLVGGLVGGTRTLSWESYRVFPLRFRSLFAGELVAGLGDSLPMVIAIALTAFLLGTAVAHPSLLPLALLLALASILVLLLVQMLVGVLAAALVKRLRVALVVLGVAAWAGFVLSLRLPQALGQGLEAGAGGVPLARLKALGLALLRVLDALPATQAARGLAEALRGDWASALLRFTYPAGGALLLLALAGWALAGEAAAGPGPGPAAQGARPERLWTFRSPVEGLARLHGRTLLGSHLGKFGFLVPLMTVVLLKGPLAHVRHQAHWGVPSAFLYLGLMGSQVQFNQFGLDGHGIKALLLLPLPPRHLLLGKCLGLAAYQGLQALVLTLLLVLAGDGTPGTLVASLALAGCVFLAQSALGHWTSAWLPRPLPRDSLKNSNAALPVTLLGMVASSTFAGFYGGAYALLAWRSPGWLAPGMLALFALSLGAYRGLLPRAAAYLDGRREALLASLG